MTAFPHLFFFHVSEPRFEAEWERGAIQHRRAILVLALEGAVSVNGELVEPGQLFFVPPEDAKLSVSGGNGANDFLCITFGVNTLPGLPALSNIEGGIVPHLESQQLAPCVAFIQALCTPENNGDLTVGPLEGVAHELVRALMQTVVDVRSDADPLYTKVVRILEMRYAEQGLNAALVANEIGVSVRSLQLVFEERGETVATTLRVIRARAATANRLVNPKMTNAELALLSGFGSESSMYRAMRDYQAGQFCER
ncbi:helix-turn-helix domain-containing protein [Leucobacter chinensis]|uniref:helix-turn-helix domain-containing protein n=1 Tax=Leucobacter chinensis TaxID=2851010 RepID=UPI001C23A558|nr:helix-turn-helix domain-containing protein [Leucobacter chinensis]